jgi:hypothetical protein
VVIASAWGTEDPVFKKIKWRKFLASLILVPYFQNQGYEPTIFGDYFWRLFLATIFGDFHQFSAIFLSYY